jgi:hypothetical protein
MRRWHLFHIFTLALAAENPAEKLDKEFIQEVENPANEKSSKVLHAEPLFIDLIRDLGARAGEAEVNLGYGVTDKREFARFEYLAEIEWAPINRLGVEFELPFSDTARYGEYSDDQPAQNGLNSIKTAAQYTFYVSERYATSAAIGYLHEFLRGPALTRSASGGFAGNLYNPFLIVAHRWDNHWHTLLYAGPRHSDAPGGITSWENNLSVHYMLAGTRHFVGIEINQQIHHVVSTVHFRPQIRLQLTDHILTGIVAGIPDNLRRDGLSSFVRLIYEIS